MEKKWERIGKGEGREGEGGEGREDSVFCEPGIIDPSEGKL